MGRPAPQAATDIHPAVADAPATIQQKGKQHRTKLLELRIMFTKTLSVRCECDLSTEAWSCLKDSPQIRSLAWKAIERIILDRYIHHGDDDETAQGN
jgi:hypothetical protein